MKLLLNKKIVSIILFLFGAAMIVACGGGGGGGGGGGSTTPSTSTGAPILSNATLDPATATIGKPYSGQLTVTCTDTDGDVIGGQIRYAYDQFLSNPVSIFGWDPNNTLLIASVNIPNIVANKTEVTIWIWDKAGNQSAPIVAYLQIS